MKKIEKLEEFNWVSGRDAITIALCNTIIRKQNEIIDYLNTQPKEEVTAEWLYRKNKKRLEDLTEKELKKRGITKTQDTPEEWEKKVSVLIKEGLFEEVTDDKGERVFGYVECSDKVLKEIKQLLSEREREVLESMRDWVIEYYKDTWNIRDFDAEKAIGKIVDRELDKLNEKK